MTDAAPQAEQAPDRAASPPPDHQRHPALIRDNLVPIITPRTASGDVDADAIDRLVSFHSELGSGGLFAVGGMGRFHELSDARRVKAAGAFASANRRRGSPLVVFAGATSETAGGTLENLREMAALGADAVFVAPLYFLTHGEVPGFVRRAREALGPRLPLLLYNNPDFARRGGGGDGDGDGDGSRNLRPETLREVAADASAVKDSSCDPDLFARYASVGVPLYAGDEPRLVDCVRGRGSRGCVCGLGNVTATPGKLARRLAAAADGDGEAAEGAIAELSVKFDGEVATLRRVVDAHPDVPAPDVVTAVFHHCLAEAGLVRALAELVKILKPADTALLRENGFIPTI